MPMRDWMMDLCNLPSVRVLWGELAFDEEYLQGSVVGDRQIISNLCLDHRLFRFSLRGR